MEFPIKVNEKSQMAQQVRKLAAMPNDPEFSFRLHTLGKRTEFCSLSSDS